MRVRSLVTVLATSCLLAAALVRCTLPSLPPGPQAIATRIGLAGGAIVAVPAGATIDRPALIASLAAMRFNTVIIQASADANGESVSDRVSLAVELQAALGARVFVGGYQATALSGKSMDALLQKDATFKSCYPTGPALDADAAVIDKIRICSEDIGKKLAGELARVSASASIGCYITHQPQLVDRLTADGQTRLQALFVDAASACTGANRPVAAAPILPAQPGDPTAAAVLLRDALQGSGVSVVILEDGVAIDEPRNPRRASTYYDALRVALEDGPPPVEVWAAVEAFDCATDAGCDRTRPTSSARFTSQVCGARTRVDKIIAYEYLHDLAERPLFTGDLDAALSADASSEASTEVRAILDDRGAAAQLRDGYLAWVDAGASCSAAAAAEADAEAQAAAAADAGAGADAAR